MTVLTGPAVIVGNGELAGAQPSFCWFYMAKICASRKSALRNIFPELDFQSIAEPYEAEVRVDSFIEPA